MSEDIINATEGFLSKISNLNAISDDIVSKVLVPTIKIYQEKVNVGIQDSISDLLDNFKQRIVDTVIQTTSHWKLPQRDLLLFPKNCRFCYQKGQSTIFVIEEEPQVRSLVIENSIMGKIYDSNTHGNSRVPLALPYIIFVMHFKNNNLNYVYSSWSVNPLTSLENMLYFPLLPNLHDNLSVCMADMPNRKTLNMLEKIDIALNGYWNSEFNSDLADRWWSKHLRHPKLESCKTWSEASLENPLFIREAKLQSAKTLKNLLDVTTKHETEVDENALLHNLTERIDETTKLLFNKILAFMRKTSFDKYYPKSVNEQLAGIMKEANTEIANFYFVLENELKLLRQELEKDHNKQKPLLGGPAWIDYEE